MFHRTIETLADVVTTHNQLVILSMLVLTAGVVVGVDRGADSPGGGGIDVSDTDVGRASDYIAANYDDGSDVATAQAYVRADDGNVLSRAALLAVIDYQQTVVDDPAVADALASDAIDGPPNVVATRLADEPDPTLAEQRAALKSTSAAEVRRVVAETFTGGEPTRTFLPSSYEPGTPTARGMRLTFEVTTTSGGRPFVPYEVEQALYETSQRYDDPDVITAGSPTWSDLNQQYLVDTLWLVLPPILVVMLVVLAFAYRDVVDVVVGMAGTLVALLWTFGLMGWFGLLGRRVALVAPVLIIALSLDFGLHIFMRYREVGGTSEGLRASMARGVALVTFPFVLVTVSTAVGFVPTLTNPVPVIRDLGVAIILGTVASLVIFVTLVPALKVSVEGLLERAGFDRRNAVLGQGTYLRRVLLGSLRAARRAAPVVVVVALVAAGLGGYAFTGLERGTSQQVDFDVADWKTNLPGPMAFDSFSSPAAERIEFEERFQPDDEASDPSRSLGYTQFLVRGTVTDPAAMEAIASAKSAAESADDVVFEQGDTVTLVSPLSVMNQVAANDPSFAETLRAADTDGDGVPDRNLETVYDELYSAAPQQAARVLERTEDGEYRSLRVFVPTDAAPDSERADAMHEIADAMAEDSGLTVTPVGAGTVTDATFAKLIRGLVRTILLALGAVFALLVLLYHVSYDSASLGAITGIPVVLALGLVFGGMYLAGVALTFETALLVSITIGLGVDYNIHVSSRTMQELGDGATIQTALAEAVTGTGGALLGSAVTSGGAFVMMVISPDPRLQSFGLIVAFALSVSFLLSVFVLPSMIYLWARWGSEHEVDTEAPVPSD